MSKKPPPDAGDDPDSFADMASALGEVKPLEGGRRVAQSGRSSRRAEPRPRATPPRFHFPDPDEPLLGYRSGVQRAVLNRLARGEPAPESTIDLHGLNLHAAEGRLGDAIETAARTGIACLRVVHGRGTRSPDGVAVLREALPRWLTGTRLAGQVLAFAPARPRDGGRGATCVLIA